MITIGIPFYNAEKYLDLSIRSVLNQSYKDWKLILIDDGSTDSSLEIAKKYVGDKRITILFDGENKNLPARLNEIIDLAETKYLARMDADDIMHPDKLKIQIGILEENPQIDVLGTNAFSINEYNIIKGVRKLGNYDENEIIDVDTFIHPSIVGKTSWFKKNKYDPRAIRLEDFELWQRTKSASIFKSFTQPLLYYREFGDNYYKKYFSGIKSSLYIADKLKKNKLYINIMLNMIKGTIYFSADMIGQEQKLIDKRNIKLDENELLSEQKSLDNIIKNFQQIQKN